MIIVACWAVAAAAALFLNHAIHSLDDNND
jgi:hypothetical protein